jgi:hypothetical protein
MTTNRRPRKKVGGKWVFVPDETKTPEQIQQEKEHWVVNTLGSSLFLNDDSRETTLRRFAVVDQMRDYFPGDQQVPEGGAWVLVKRDTGCQYTMPLLSVWFAEPWPMESNAVVVPFRAKILTPRGELGIFPREYSIVPDPQKFYEYFGKGVKIRFFGGDTAGIPEDKLFYIRSRGVSKADAIALLLGNIKSPGICWIETDHKVAKTFYRPDEFPHPSRLATYRFRPKKVQVLT